MPKHKHADLIIAWANGVEIEYKSPRFNNWVTPPFFSWNGDGEYRIKPERVWPVTSLTEEQLEAIFNDAPGLSFECIANAAIKRYIEDNEK